MVNVWICLAQGRLTILSSFGTGWRLIPCSLLGFGEEELNHITDV